MKHKTLMKQVVSVLLVFVLAVGLVLPSLAVDSTKAVTESGKGLTFEQVDNDEYDVKLPNREDASLDENVDIPKYDPTDVVRVSIVLEDPSTLEQGFTADDVSSQSRKAMKYRQKLQDKQEKMEDKISAQALDGEALDVAWNLTLAANIISANVEYGQIEEIEKVKGVKEVLIETQYDPCVVNSDEAVDPNMSTSDEMIGSISAWASGYTGAGRKIAIIDTGADVDHPSLDPDAFSYSVKDSGATLMTSADTAKVLSQLNAAEAMSGITADQLYVNAKIPYGFNYVDTTLNIGHDADAQSDHGSHVAGIAAANRYVKAADGTYASALDTALVQGVAPDAQLLVMKVFGVRGGAYVSDYMAAIEDAMVLGADSANLSLGSQTVGNSRVEEKYSEILERVVDSGMVVVMSAGNSGSWYENSYNKFPYADGVSWATVGSPGTYTNSLGVASVDNIGMTGCGIDFGDHTVYYSETLEGSDGTHYKNVSITTLAGEHEYVYLDSIGTEEEFAAIADVLAGKVAICNRGSTNFTAKAENAVNNGAIATIIANNQLGTINMDFSDYTKTEPAVTITLSDALLVKANSTAVKDDSGKILYYTGTLNIADKISAGVSDYDYYTMSSFSSWGIPGSLEMKPEITAPGGHIYSLKNGGTYQNMSGTSMAAPQVTGMVAVLDQYIEENGYAQKTGLTLRALAQSLLMSTAEPMLEDEDTYYPVLRQGAGLANIGAAVSAGSYLMMDADATDSYKDGKIKVELGDDPDRTGTFSFGYTINNLEDTATAFTLFADFFTQALFTSQGMVFEDTITAPIPANVSFSVDGETVAVEADADMDHCDFNGDGKINTDDGQALLDYVTGVREEISNEEYADFDADGGIDTYDAYLFFKRLGTVAVQVPANGSVHVTVNVTLDKATLDAYDSYSDGTGTYIEGYVYASELSSAEGELGTVHSIPVLGYYGSWTDGSMFDVGSYIDYYISLEEDRPPYLYDEKDEKTRQYQVLTTKDFGASRAYAFGGNPYIEEDFYEQERDSINTDATAFDKIAFTAIRNFANSRLILKDSAGNTYIDTNAGGSTGAYYYESDNAAYWDNVQFSISIGSNMSKTPEGAQLDLSLTLAPEYYLDAEGNVNWDALGKGATKSYSAYVDKTAPVISDITLGESVTSGTKTMSVTASDNRYIATVALFDYDTDDYVLSGSTPAGSPAGQTDTFQLEMDEDMQAAEHLLVQVYDYAGNYATYKINRNEEELNAPVSVTISKTSLSLLRGTNATLSAEVSPFGVKPDGVTWTSSNEQVATVSQNGLVTAVSNGEATITAASVKDPTKTASCNVTVESIAVTLNGAVQDEEGKAFLYTWNLDTDSKWTGTVPLASESVVSSAYDTRNKTVLSVDGASYGVHKVDPATGNDLASYPGVDLGGEYLPIWDVAYSEAFSTAEKPLYAYIYGSYIFGLYGADEFSAYGWNEADYLSYFTKATKFVAITSMGAAQLDVNDDGNLVDTEMFALLDNSGYIWTVVLYYEGDELKLLPWNFFQTTLPSSLTYAGYGNDMNCSLFYSEEDGYSYLYLSYFDGDTNQIYRMSLMVYGTTYYWSAKNVGNFGDKVWPATIHGVTANGTTSTDEGNSIRDVALTANAELAALKVEKTEATLAAPAPTPEPEGEPVKASVSTIAISEDEKTVTVNVVPQGEDDTTNGLLTVEYDADLLTLADVTSAVAYTSHKDEEGKVTFGYVAPDGYAAGACVATLTFTLDPTKCDDASVSVTIKQTERNDKATDTVEHLAAGIHAETEVRDAKEPTCTEKGYTGDTVCKTCGKVLEKGKEIDALGHDYKNGKCTRCGEKQPDVKTGDQSNLSLWFVVLTMSAAIAVFAAAVLLRKKQRN